MTCSGERKKRGRTGRARQPALDGLPQPRVCREVIGEDSGQATVRDGAVRFETAAEEASEPLTRGPLHQLGQEPALSDSPVPLDEQEPIPPLSPVQERT